MNQTNPPVSLPHPDPPEEPPELFEMIRLTGIPFNSKPSALELERAIEQFRQRRRADLMHFLARVIARDIRNRFPARIEGEQC